RHAQLLRRKRLGGEHRQRLLRWIPGGAHRARTSHGAERRALTVLALEPIGGVAGDMLVAALLHLGAPRSALDDGLAALAKEDPDLRSLRIVAAPAEVNGIAALHVTVEGPDAVREREPHHRPYRRIRELLARAVLPPRRSEEHTSELQSLRHLVCRLLLE